MREDLLHRFPALSRLPAHAFIVGGAIRDLLLGGDPADVDVACADPHDCASAIGSKVIRLGKDHLTAYRVVLGEHVYDFAPLLDNSIDRDLARRDFTVNAMAIPLDRDVILDPHGGRRDLESRTVRMVDPKNFDDDPLRTLKGLRLAVRHRFAIEPETMHAIRARALLITTVAAERVAFELTSILSANEFCKAVLLLRESGLDLPIFGRELDPSRFHAGDVPLAAALTLLVDDAKTFVERWRLPDLLLRDMQYLRRLIDDHSLVALYDAGESTARQLPPLLRALGRDSGVDMPDFGATPFLTGNDIATLTGLPPGRDLGRVKRALLEAQIRREVKTRSRSCSRHPERSRGTRVCGGAPPPAQVARLRSR
jgi:tRNA nucleotidyltransferase/poly(A) polymerase